MLAQFALIAFALCATLSLIVDIGYARLTQAQMQNAADAAALEGLRYRDAAADPADSDLQRRTAASVAAARVFDDDLDPTNGDPDFNFGAGPIIDLTDGLTALHGSATMTVPDVHVYKPNLQLNQDNAVHGDMVSGRFCYTDDPFASEGQVHELIDTVCAAQQTAAGSYARNDFNPNLAGATDDSAFLVRLRRSNEFSDSLGLFEDSVASGERALPLTFGRGTLIFADDPSGSYSVRRDGLTVRATAIADARPALQVGLPQTGTPLGTIAGVTPFVFSDAFARTIATGAPPTSVIVAPATGFICRTVVPAVCTAANAIGRFAAGVANVAAWRAVDTIGKPLPAPTPLPGATVAAACVTARNALAALGPVYFAPVFAAIDGTNRITGFVAVQLPSVTCPPAAVIPPPTTFTATLMRPLGRMAPSNATALLGGGLPAGVPAADVTPLLQQTQSLADASVGLLAPALAR